MVSPDDVSAQAHLSSAIGGNRTTLNKRQKKWRESLSNQRPQEEQGKSWVSQGRSSPRCCCLWLVCNGCFPIWSLLGTLVKCFYPVTGREGILAGEGCYVSDNSLGSLSSLSLLASLTHPAFRGTRDHGEIWLCYGWCYQNNQNPDSKFFCL